MWLKMDVRCHNLTSNVAINIAQNRMLLVVQPEMMMMIMFKVHEHSLGRKYFADK